MRSFSERGFACFAADGPQTLVLLYSGQIYLARPLRLGVRDLCEGLGADTLLAVESRNWRMGAEDFFRILCYSAFSVLESDLRIAHLSS